MTNESTSFNPAEPGSGARRRNLQRRARAKARAEGINYTAALRALTEGEPSDPVRAAFERITARINSSSATAGQVQNQPEYDEPSYEWPTVGELVDRKLVGDLLEDRRLLHPGSRQREFSSDVFMDVQLPAAATDVEIEWLRVESDTRDVYAYDEMDGTELVRVEVVGDLRVRALVPNLQVTEADIGAHEVVYPDIADGLTQVVFTRRVDAVFDGRIDLGAEHAELEFEGAVEVPPI